MSLVLNGEFPVIFLSANILLQGFVVILGQECAL